ncbi:DUF5709 domain-containing protein [Fodinicola feengrottensis]|uniref:DUF5709 domain-containing protein n=1 Tax=Fodinicola feengrottensis TaxID=435914 RepID=A0ABN2IZE5_9ACTN|nr:DUF5709 domain-containing protein [Fodinicola feengrottensis]
MASEQNALPPDEDPDSGLLSPQESLDDDELGGDVDDGYSPPERPSELTAWGTTAREARGHEDVGRRLAREVPDVSDTDDSDGLGDSADTDGELIDDQVGDVRAGRLASPDDVSDDEPDYWARDVGIDGGGASAEEAAMHVIPESYEDRR